MTDDDQHPTQPEAPVGGPQAALCAEHLTVGYDNAPVVPGITLELGEGQSLALVGMNGSGKSTLLKTIVGLLPPLAGDLEVLGTRPGAAPSRVAYLSQYHSSGFVLPLQAIDIVEMGRFAVRGLFGRLTIDDRALIVGSMRRMDIDDLAREPVRSLSGGQQQRVFLAQVLARRADLLVLDEPTASLDAAGREVFADVMAAELERGASVVMATHDIREAARCDLVMLLDRRVVALGAPKDVLTREALLETFGIVLTADDRSDPVVLEPEHRHGRA